MTNEFINAISQCVGEKDKCIREYHNNLMLLDGVLQEVDDGLDALWKTLRDKGLTEEAASALKLRVRIIGTMNLLAE